MDMTTFLSSSTTATRPRRFGDGHDLVESAHSVAVGKGSRDRAGARQRPYSVATDLQAGTQYQSVEAGMKLYIWRDVLRDYTPGMAVAYAKDYGSALELFEPWLREQLVEAMPLVIDCKKRKKPFGHYVYGGG